MPAGFADLLRRHRQRAAISQEELAARAGVSAKAVGALERGERRRPYPHTVRALAQALGLSDEEREALSDAARERAAPPLTGEPAQDAQGTATPHAVRAPTPPATVIGRETDVEEVVRLLLGAARLVTLTGPGGVGKTTLALQVADAVAAEFPDGLVVVELAAVREPRLVLPAVARALGMRQLEAPAVDRLAAFLGDRRLLVVLDNVEHVLDSAYDVSVLLSRCPGLSVLATSRAPLRVRREVNRPVAPLSLPGGNAADEVAASSAVRVFLDRARAAGCPLELTPAHTADIAEICRRLGGLPLALELAAAHARLLPPRDLLSHLDAVLGSPRSRDLPERQRTLRATLDWSYELLTGAEQALLRRVAVFVGGFDLTTVTQLVGGDVVATLGGLLEQSLVGAEGTRYRLLEPVRQYALARLAESGESAAVADRAADVFCALGARARGGLRSAEQASWLARLADEQANLRETFAWLQGVGRPAAAARLGADTWLFWALRGSALEALGWLTQVSEASLVPADLAALQVAVAGLRYASGDLPGMAAYAEAAVAAARAAASPELLAEALVLSGSAAVALDGGGGPQLAEAQTVGASYDDVWVLAHAAAAEGQRRRRHGDLAGCAEVLRQAMDLARSLGSPFTLATVLNARASLALAGGDHDAALDDLTAAVELAAEVGTTWTLAYSLPSLAAVAVERGQPELAAELLAAAAQAAEVTVAYPPGAGGEQATLSVLQDELGPTRFASAWTRGRTLRPEDVPSRAHAVSRRRGPA